MQTDLRLKIIQNHISKNGIQVQIAFLLSVYWFFFLKNGKFATFVFWSFHLKLPYFKSSQSVVFENNHVLPENFVLMYSKIFFKFKIQVFKKMPKQKMYALEDSLGVYTAN